MRGNEQTKRLRKKITQRRRVNRDSQRPNRKQRKEQITRSNVLKQSRNAKSIVPNARTGAAVYSI